MEANMDRFLVHCGPKYCSTFQSNSSYLVTPQNQFFKKKFGAGDSRNCPKTLFLQNKLNP